MTNLQELDDLRWEAHQLGIANLDKYTTEQLKFIIAKKKIIIVEKFKKTTSPFKKEFG